MLPRSQQSSFASQIPREFVISTHSAVSRRHEPTSDMVDRGLAARSSYSPAQGSAAWKHGIDQIKNKDPKKDDISEVSRLGVDKDPVVSRDFAWNQLRQDRCRDPMLKSSDIPETRPRRTLITDYELQLRWQIYFAEAQARSDMMQKMIFLPMVLKHKDSVTSKAKKEAKEQESLRKEFMFWTMQSRNQIQLWESNDRVQIMQEMIGVLSTPRAKEEKACQASLQSTEQEKIPEVSVPQSCAAISQKEKISEVSVPQSSAEAKRTATQKRNAKRRLKRKESRVLEDEQSKAEVFSQDLEEMRRQAEV